MCGRDESLPHILNAGADVNKIGGRMGTALSAAAFRGSLEIVQQLLGLRAQVNLGN